MKKKLSGWSTPPLTVEVPGEPDPFVQGFLEWMDSPEGELSEEVLELTWKALRDVDVDAAKRQLIWPDGQRLSLDASVQHIGRLHPELPVDLIETHLIGWLVGNGIRANGLFTGRHGRVGPVDRGVGYRPLPGSHRAVRR